MFDVFLSYLLGRFAEARAGSTGDSRNRNSEEYRAVFSQERRGDPYARRASGHSSCWKVLAVSFLLSPTQMQSSCWKVLVCFFFSQPMSCSGLGPVTTLVLAVVGQVPFCLIVVSIVWVGPCSLIPW